jgi:hypothetical protein
MWPVTGQALTVASSPPFNIDIAAVEPLYEDIELAVWRRGYAGLGDDVAEG